MVCMKRMGVLPGWRRLLEALIERGFNIYESSLGSIGVHVIEKMPSDCMKASARNGLCQVCRYKSESISRCSSISSTKPQVT